MTVEMTRAVSGSDFVVSGGVVSAGPPTLSPGSESADRLEVMAALAERDRALAEAVELRGRVAVVREELSRVRVEFDQRIESMTDAAHEYADDHDLCGVFDQFMESQGLRTRSRDYDLEIDATIRVRVTLTRNARDGYDARECVDNSDVEYAVAEKLSTSVDNVDVEGYDVVEVTAS